MICLVLLLAVAAATAAPATDLQSQAHDELWREVTDGCGQSKSCFLHPADCFITKNCELGVSILVVGDVYTFELQSVGGIYAAVGLSADDKMGADSVVECVSDDQSAGADKLSLYVSYNTGHQNSREPDAAGITLTDSNYDVDSKTATCTFTRPKSTTFQEVEFNLDTEQYYLLLAAGTKLNTNGDGIGFHDAAYVASSGKRYVADIGYFPHP